MKPLQLGTIKFRKSLYCTGYPTLVSKLFSNLVYGYWEVGFYFYCDTQLIIEGKKSNMVNLKKKNLAKLYKVHAKTISSIKDNRLYI